jgi:glycosyltransferase involved in cell wall biosynthesis
MKAENNGIADGKKIVIIANFATDRVNGPYNVIENLAVHANQQGYRCELWGMSTEIDKNDYQFYVHFAANLFSFSVPDDMKRKLIVDRDDILCVNLHSVFTPINIAIANLVKSLDIKLCITPHGGYHDYSFKRNFLKKKIFTQLFESKFLRQMDYFFIFGKQEGDFIRKYSSKNQYILLNGFPGDKIKQPIYNPPVKASDSKLKLLFLGRLDPMHKGLDMLIKSIAYLKDENIELTIAGPTFNEASQQYLRQLIIDTGVASRIAFRGPVYQQAEKELLYASHHVFVHTSRWEGMPMGVIEALCYGMPVLVSKATNLAGIVSENQFGYVTDDLTPQAIAQVIAGICNGKHQLSEFSQNAWNRSSRIFNWNKITQQYVDAIYSESKRYLQVV